MRRSPSEINPQEPIDLYDYLHMPQAPIGRPPRHDLSTWTVTDDWPEPVPVSVQEVEIFEAWFGDLFEELFGTGSRLRCLSGWASSVLESLRFESAV